MKAGLQEDLGFILFDKGWWDSRLSEPETDGLQLLQVASHLPPTSSSPSGWEKGHLKTVP